MTHETTRRDEASIKSSTDSLPTDEADRIDPTPAEKFADAYADSDGNVRLIANPFGEWIESDHVVEVQR